MLQEQDGQFAFFLGAGCSISSGIHGARSLVERWLPMLYAQMTGGKATPDTEWLKKEFPKYDPSNPAASYAAVMRQLFMSPVERQREIERIVKGQDPGFGYAVLAKLMTQTDCGRNCNLILTTNFDDLVADALYLYTQHKPLVIVHESLVGFVETGRMRPLVIKLHGDALLEPRNTEEETRSLDEKVRRVLADQLAKRGLIFLGYGGNDTGITSFVRELSAESLTWGIYWVNDTIPNSEFGGWFQSRPGAMWVNHLRFDELMVLIRSEFNLTHPEETRFENLMSTYRQTFEKLAQTVAERPTSEEKQALSTAVEKAEEEAGHWWSFVLTARSVERSNPDKADEIYRAGLARFENSPELLGSYAIFLLKVRKDFDQAETYFRRALDANPNHFVTLSNYGVFLHQVRKDFDGAETHFRRALDANPDYGYALGNYGGFLLVKGEARMGLELVQRALEHAERPSQDALVLECQYYLYANGPAEGRAKTLATIRSLLQKGVRSPDSELSGNIERAEKDGHRNVPLLKALAAVILDEAPLATLAQFEEWRNAAKD